jgi:FKBP-type peptidyl-prolyl cis-trans isomerase FklB
MRKKWMNRLIVLAVGLLVAGAGCTSEQTPAKTPDKATVAAPVTNAKPSIVLKTPMDQMSYSYGVETARGLKQQGVEFNPDAITQGMKDVLAGDKLPMSDEELRTNVAAFRAEVRSKQVRTRLMTAQDNKQAGDAFMAENKTKEGVVTLPSGLQYKILKEGNGPKPTDLDTVACNYRGTLIDGTEFDTSAHPNNEGEPAEFRVSQVIPGWREALKLMPVGSKWQLFVPPNLAYGQRGAGRNIGPYATLIFEVELVAIK